MKRKTGFTLHQVCEQNIIVGEGKENIDFNNLVTMNETSAFLWNKMEGKDFTVDDMVAALCGEYDVTEDVARKDCGELVKSWLEAGIIEE